MIIAIDFDGTLHTGAWPSIGEPAKNTAEVLRKLKSDGHYLIIWTCREGNDQTEMVNWLLANKIPFDRVNDNKPNSWESYGYNARKIYADVYIDNRQLGGLPTWDEIYDKVCLMEKQDTFVIGYC